MEARQGYVEYAPNAYSAAIPSNIQIRFDRLLVAVLLFSGWSLEWTWGRQEGPIALVFLYVRLSLYPFFFCYYFLNRKRLRSSNASLGALPFLLFAFIGICLAERISNDFVDTWILWKDYYYLALLPLWGLLGFDLGGNVRRIQLLFYRLAVSGSLLSYVSFSMQAIGISGESLVGPMYWPFRFIVIFSFFYFLSIITTGLNRTGKTFFWLAGSSLAVFWGLYKFTIVCTALGVAVWGIFMVMKGRFHGKRGILSFLALATLSLIGVAAVNQLAGGSLFSTINDTYNDKWLHNINEIESKDPLDKFDRITAGRYQIWQEVTRRVPERPLLGAGLGQKYKGAIVIHNGYFDLLLSFGILGLAVFFSGLIIWLRRLARSHLNKDTLLIQLVCVGYIFMSLAANLFGSVWIQFFTISFYITFLSGISYRLCAERETC